MTIEVWVLLILLFLCGVYTGVGIMKEIEDWRDKNG